MYFWTSTTNSSHWFFFVFFWIYIFVFFVFSSFLRGDPKIGKNKGDERELVGALSLFFSFSRERQWRRKRLEWVLLVFENGYYVCVFRMEIRFYLFILIFIKVASLSYVFNSLSIAMVARLSQVLSSLARFLLYLYVIILSFF